MNKKCLYTKKIQSFNLIITRFSLFFRVKSEPIANSNGWKCSSDFWPGPRMATTALWPSTEAWEAPHAFPTGGCGLCAVKKRTVRRAARAQLFLCYLCPTTFSFYRLKPRSTCMFYISITDNKQEQMSRLVNLVQFFFSLFLGLCQLKLPSGLTFTVSRLIYWIVLWVAVNSDVLSTLLMCVKELLASASHIIQHQH